MINKLLGLMMWGSRGPACGRQGAQRRTRRAQRMVVLSLVALLAVIVIDELIFKIGNTLG